MTTTTLPVAITGKFNIALTQHKYQNLVSSVESIERTEDNLEKINDILKNARTLYKAIEEVHKVGKSAALQECQNWDNAKKAHLKMVTDVFEPLSADYSKLCMAIENRRIAEEKEKKRIESIQNTISQTALNFSQRIAKSETVADLLAIEREINLEKSRTSKYEEFLPQAISAFNELNSMLANQKIECRKLDDAKAEKEAAILTNNDEKLLEVIEKIEESEQKIEEQKINIQNTAIETQLTQNVPIVAEEIFPQVKARRTTWKYELVDVKETIKKAPEMLDISLNYDKAKEVLKVLKETKQLENKTEVFLNGVRYYEERTY